MKLNENVLMVSLQFSFSNPEAIPVLVRHRSNEMPEERVVRTAHQCWFGQKMNGAIASATAQSHKDSTSFSWLVQRKNSVSGICKEQPRENKKKESGTPAFFLFVLPFFFS